MRIFDTNVQEIKYKTLKEVIRSAYEGNLQSAALDIPKSLRPAPSRSCSCCIYKERAILGERVKPGDGRATGTTPTWWRSYARRATSAP